MWTLIWSQLRYHAGWLLGILVPLLAGAVFATGRIVETDRVSLLWMLWVLMGGMLSQVFIYHQDLQERRPLLWLELPVTPGQVIGARLTLSLLCHLVLLGLAFAVIAVLSPAAFTAETLLEVLAGNGLAILTSFSIYAGEDVGIRLADRRSLFWFAQLAFASTIVLVALDPLEWFPRLQDPAGVVGLHLVAALCAAAAYRMFVSRSNFLMGTDPNCGLPVDWSRSE